MILVSSSVSSVVTTNKILTFVHPRVTKVDQGTVVKVKVTSPESSATVNRTGISPGPSQI